MKTTFTSLLCGLFILAILGNGAAQNTLVPCATNAGISDWLRDFQSRIAGVQRTDDILYVPIQIHLVGTSQGEGHMDYYTMLRSFCTLNNDFAASEIQFYLAGPVNYINNNNYYVHNFSQGFQMMNEHNVPGVINSYIVETAAGACGYFSPGGDAVAMAIDCTQPNDHTWAHEIGHFLSLPHPFNGLEGADDLDYDEPMPEVVDGWPVEKRDGSNCEFAGDGFCDTSADYLNDRWSCTFAGISTQEQIDPDGVTFNSDASLFMSYSLDACPDRFSDEQILAMRANIEEERTYLLTPDPGDRSIPEDQETVDVIFPQEDDIVNTPSVRIEWDEIENADFYRVQINPISSFGVVINEFTVNEPFVDFDNMLPNKTYYWRVRPYGNYDTCTSFLDKESFTTGEGVVNTQELLPDERALLIPNPTTQQQNTTLLIESSESGTASWRISTLQGQILNQERTALTSGEQRIELPTHSLPAGIYWVEISLNQRHTTKKLVVH